MTATEGANPGRRDRLIREKRHDTYRAAGRPKEPTVCEECGAGFRDGRWAWVEGPFDAEPSVCPACRRIRDDYPAGYVTLRGPFAAEHREELVNLARNVESREKSSHPLKRIMAVNEDDDALVITTTDVHLARSIGDALQAAYAGDLLCQYGQDENLVRVQWTR